MSGARTKSASGRLAQTKASGRLESSAKRSSTAGERLGCRPTLKINAGGGTANVKPSSRLNAKTVNPVSHL